MTKPKTESYASGWDASAPSLDKGFGIACDDLELSKRYVVYPGAESYPIRHGVQVIGLAELAALLL